MAKCSIFPLNYKTITKSLKIVDLKKVLMIRFIYGAIDAIKEGIIKKLWEEKGIL